jgi:heme/copper-type cytochrome/quinol oxidase subunit 2
MAPVIANVHIRNCDHFSPSGISAVISSDRRAIAVFATLVVSLLLVMSRGGTEKAVAYRSSSAPYLIRLTGEKMAWHVRYAGSDECLDTADDILSEHDLHLPAERQVKVLLTSRDLLYTIAIQRHQIHEIAVPEVEFALNLPVDAPGEYRFRGDQMCGFQHEQLFGRIVVHKPSEFDNWIAQQSGHR